MRSVREIRCAFPMALVLALSACGSAATGTASGGTSTTAAPTSAAVVSSSAATSATATASAAVSSSTVASVSSPSSAAASSAAAASTSAASSATSAAASSTSAAASSGGTSGAATGAPVSFKADIQPLLQANCTGCHGSAKPGGLSLLSFADVMAGGKDGVIVKAGDADSSLIVQKVKGTQTIGARMPRGGTPLPAADIQKIADWIAQGAKDN